MKSKGSITVSFFQIFLGVLAIISFFVVKDAGEDMRKWMITLILAAAFIILGAAGIVGNVSRK